MPTRGHPVSPDSKSNLVRDRIRQWQSQGGGVKEEPAQDSHAHSHLHGRDAAYSSTSRTKATELGTCLTPAVFGEQRSKGGKDGERIPTRRVISDGQWRNPRGLPKGVALPTIEVEDTFTKTSAKPSSHQARHGTHHSSDVTCRRISKSSFECTGPVHGHLSNYPESLSEPRKKSTWPTGKPDAPSKKRMHSCGARPIYRIRSQRSFDQVLGTNAVVIPDDTPETVDSQRCNTCDNAGMANISVLSPDSRSNGRKSQPSHKGRKLSQVLEEGRKGFRKCSSTTGTTPRVPSIEQWLDATPDQFLDTNISPALEGLHSRSPVHDLQTGLEVERLADPTIKPFTSKNRSPLDTKEGTRRVVTGSKRRRRIPSSAIYHDNPFPADFEYSSETKYKAPETASKLIDLVHCPSEDQRPSSRLRNDSRTPVSQKENIQPPGQDMENPEAVRSDVVTASFHKEKCVSGVDQVPSWPPDLICKQPFPSTVRHRLSTIASTPGFESKAQCFDDSSVRPMFETGLKPTQTCHEDSVNVDNVKLMTRSLAERNESLTRHTDLLSVLSMTASDPKSMKVTQSDRSTGDEPAANTLADVLGELRLVEIKYMRELQTLVDGVIPVLLTCVLSRADSAVAAGLFSFSQGATSDPHFTKPIVDMGIALERLRSLHRRLPREDVSALLTWAHGAHRVYSDYLKAWRLGFQDVVVNLAPSSHSAEPVYTNSQEVISNQASLPRNKEGDVTDYEGQRVDVAYLLKRPLIRLKHLAKTFRTIHTLALSAEAHAMSQIYHALVEDARQRLNEENARLEDEAAALLDTTRCRDLRTLAPLLGVVTDKSRRVCARDQFDLSLHHSSGQRVDCRVELILRDGVLDGEERGDLLICEMNETERWLLFPPIQRNLVSARNDRLHEGVTVMIRGRTSDNIQWQEMLSLASMDEHTDSEWSSMLGPGPLPPHGVKTPKIVAKSPKNDRYEMTANLNAKNSLRSAGDSMITFARSIETPIGEQAYPAFETCREPDATYPAELISAPSTPSLTSRHSPQLKPMVTADSAAPVLPPKNFKRADDLCSLPSQNVISCLAQSKAISAPRTFKEALGLSGSSSVVGLRRSRAKRETKNSIHGPRTRSAEKDCKSAPGNARSDSSSYVSSKALGCQVSLNRQMIWPSGDDAIITNESIKGVASFSESHCLPATISSAHTSTPQASSNGQPPAQNQGIARPVKSFQGRDALPPGHRKLTKTCFESSKNELCSECRVPEGNTYAASNSDQAELHGSQNLQCDDSKERRSSSPLKHEYEPSSASASSSVSEDSIIGQDLATSTSDSFDEEVLEDDDVPTPLLPLAELENFSRPALNVSVPARSLRPSDSASQARGKAVPSQGAKACKTIASIFSWSDGGHWQSLHPDECSIVVTPGMIEAFEMSSAHSSAGTILNTQKSAISVASQPSSGLRTTSQSNEMQSGSPLVALELTPLVPLRRGTAIDISVRSPPIASSRITSSNNVMFRSRNPEECEALYALINHARIHNPTFVALDNARGLSNGAGASSGIAPSRRARGRVEGVRTSWFGGRGRSSSYRASTGRTRSLAPSESSVGSINSAFSALKRFSTRNGNGIFNIAKSTIGSRTFSQANSIYTSSERSLKSGASTPVLPELPDDVGKDEQIGLRDAQIRLYIRETASKWRDMGAAHLTIMKAHNAHPNPDGLLLSSGSPQESASPDRRILIHGRTKGEVLLDAQLGESCFERVARTGIALSVWEDVVGPNGELGVVNAVGGVAGGRSKVYMIQMKSEAETAFTFSLVGKLRY